MSEREAHVQQVWTTFDRTMQQHPRSHESLVYATGLLLGVRSHLATLDDWQRWGHCVAVLLRARHEADVAAGARHAGEGEG